MSSIIKLGSALCRCLPCVKPPVRPVPCSVLTTESYCLHFSSACSFFNGWTLPLSITLQTDHAHCNVDGGYFGEATGSRTAGGCTSSYDVIAACRCDLGCFAISELRLDISGTSGGQNWILTTRPLAVGDDDSVNNTRCLVPSLVSSSPLIISLRAFVWTFPAGGPVPGGCPCPTYGAEVDVLMTRGAC